jgi:hypothetical protein
MARFSLCDERDPRLEFRLQAVRLATPRATNTERPNTHNNVGGSEPSSFYILPIFEEINRPALIGPFFIGFAFSRLYSDRSAIIGSTFAARRAGR